MYTLKVYYGDVDDELDDDTTEILGTYESLDEACEAAQSKFDAILDGLWDSGIYYSEIEGSHKYSYGVTDGDRNVEFGLVLSGPDYYCHVSVVES